MELSTERGNRKSSENDGCAEGEGAEVENQPSSELTDGRCKGDFETRYTITAWVQIGLELLYLIFALTLVSGILVFLGYMASAYSTESFHGLSFELNYQRDRKLLLWVTVALSGAAGGCAFALKWLYHSVAKQNWNRDRVLWRFIVPPLSGVFAVFVAFMISSEIVPFLNSKAFDNFYMCLGGGFFLGYFSDNVLASLQNLAVKWFGTVDGRFKSDEN